MAGTQHKRLASQVLLTVYAVTSRKIINAMESATDRIISNCLVNLKVF